MDEATGKQLDQARQRLGKSLQDTKTAIARTQAEIAELAERQRQAERDDRVNERFEEAARSGEIGRDMHYVQTRVDRGEVAWHEVFAGQVDDEAMTRAARRTDGTLRLAVESGAPPRDVPVDDEAAFGNPLGQPGQRW
ncbi:MULTISPECIES: hypothetical protein [Saccharothrix]|uniref:hypothetical protein n=1 Tax=Saccharothrix TaxID=2071 RepID=UPI0009403FF7|nr:hypothetical protein [Saccharothrix sp. CB00851]OKI36896.1 hypothetical protein A6A25_20595 [Saccharothrix sp. CB00851]